jgi:hypothetical protein
MTHVESVISQQQLQQHQQQRPPRNTVSLSSPNSKTPVRPASTISVGNASHGSFGLQQSKQSTVEKKPAIELVHRTTSIGSSGSILRKHTVPVPLPSNVSKDSNDSIATPSSVHLVHTGSTNSKPYALSRDLSDLSGSYYNGNTGRSTSTAIVTPNLHDNDTTATWKHAKVLSSPRLPQHPQPHYIDDESSYGANRNLQLCRRQSSFSSSSLSPLQQQQRLTVGSKISTIPFVSMERGDVIEVCMPQTSAATSSDGGMSLSTDKKNVNRLPLVLVLMDPSRKLYELLQLWIDTSIDTVRDILQTINKNIVVEQWKQDYDGLFQIRNNHFSQLIHVLPAGKYDIVPGEIWICKPWSMTSKQTVSYAGTLLNHLKSLQILQYRKCSEYGPIWKQWKVFRSTSNNNNTSNNKLDDTVLVLSKKATQRLYVPGGILKHHHACQFLAFVPPFETNNVDVVVVQDGTTRRKNRTVAGSSSNADIVDCSQSSASGLSDSHCDDEIDLLDDIDYDEGTTHDINVEKNDVVYNDGSIEQAEDLDYSKQAINNDQDGTISTTDHGAEEEGVEDGTQLPFIPLQNNYARSIDDGDVGNATVCSAKTKESTYIFRPFPHDNNIRNTPTAKVSATWNSRPMPHKLPSLSNSGVSIDRPTSTSSSSSSFKRTLRRLYTLFQCRQQSVLNRRSRSYDDQLHYLHTNYSTGSSKFMMKQRKSSNATRTTILSDDASILSESPTGQMNNNNQQHQMQYQQWGEIDTASHCSGVPLLLTSSPTADWVRHV